MIVARCHDPVLRRALRAAASIEQDVVTEPELVAEALQQRLARLPVRDDGFVSRDRPGQIPVMDLDDTTLRRRENERCAAGVPVSRSDFLARPLRVLIEPSAGDADWVDATLADLSRAAGARLPLSLRAFARRVMWFPTRYTTATLVQLTPTEVRTVHGWNALLITFAWTHRTPEALDGWAGLDQLFQRRAACGCAVPALAPSAALAAALATDRGLALPLALGAGLLVVAALAELGVEPGTLHLTLEPAQGAVETLVVLDDDFQAAPPPSGE